MEAGWIKIYRSILDSPCGSRGAVYLGAMVWLVIQARHTDGYEKGVELKRGQLFVGRHEMAGLLDISEMAVRCLLAKLEQTGFITRKTTSKGTVITICNYDIYQGEETEEQPADNQQPASNQPASSQQLTTNKELRINNNNNACTRIRGKLAPAVDALFGDWLRMYSTVHNHGRELSEQAVTSNLRKFMNLPEAQQIASLEWSIQRETKSVAIIDPAQAAAPAADTAAPVDEWELMKAAARSAGKGVSA